MTETAENEACARILAVMEATDETRHQHTRFVGLLDGLLKSKCKQEQTPLHDAAAHGREAVVVLLITLGADVSAKCDYGRMPLHTASHLGHEQTVLLLLEHGAGISAKNNAVETA